MPADGAVSNAGRVSLLAAGAGGCTTLVGLPVVGLPVEALPPDNGGLGLGTGAYAAPWLGAAGGARAG